MERMTYLLIAGGLGLLGFCIHPVVGTGGLLIGGLAAWAINEDRRAGYWRGSGGGGDGGGGCDGGGGWFSGDWGDGGCDGGGCDGGGGDGGGGDGGGGD